MHSPFSSSMIALLYVGPDQMLPIVSTIGGVIGFALICWGRVVAIFRKITQRGVPTPTRKQE